jgi:hypothetical protein
MLAGSIGVLVYLPKVFFPSLFFSGECFFAFVYDWSVVVLPSCCVEQLPLLGSPLVLVFF